MAYFLNNKQQSTKDCSLQSLCLIKVGKYSLPVLNQEMITALF
jgi:hypothetical protein